MTARDRLPASSPPAAAPADRIFGPPALIEGEDADAYRELSARVSAAVKPADMLEEIWVRDVVDLSWEVLRLRRLKRSQLAIGMDAALGWTLGAHIDRAERIDRMLVSAEVRRNAALNEIACYRAGLARSLRWAAETVEDAEFEVIAPSGPGAA